MTEKYHKSIWEYLKFTISGSKAWFHLKSFIIQGRFWHKAFSQTLTVNYQECDWNQPQQDWESSATPLLPDTVRNEGNMRHNSHYRGMKIQLQTWGAAKTFPRSALWHAEGRWSSWETLTAGIFLGLQQTPDVPLSPLLSISFPCLIHHLCLSPQCWGNK